MNQKTLFISYAIEEKELLTNFLDQAVKEKFPYKLDYMDEKDPVSDTWRNECRERVEKSNGVIVLMSKTIKASEGAYWEWKCSNESGRKMICIFAGDAGIQDKPLDLRNVFTMVLDWERLKSNFDNAH